MKGWLERLRDAISLGSDEDTVRNHLVDVTTELGCDAYVYLSFDADRIFAVSNYRKDWQKTYFNHDCSKIDPIIAFARTTMRAFTWRSEDWWQRACANSRNEEKSFWETAMSFNIRSGVTMPVKTGFGRMAMLTLVSRHPDSGFDEGLDCIAAAGVIGMLHGRLTTMAARPTARSKVSLSTREEKYLKWISTGKSMEEIAVIENVKYNTVKLNVESAKRKLNSYTQPQVVAAAIRFGLM